MLRIGSKPLKAARPEPEVNAEGTVVESQLFGTWTNMP
jgi:hypothetical protein